MWKMNRERWHRVWSTMVDNFIVSKKIIIYIYHTYNVHTSAYTPVLSEKRSITIGVFSAKDHSSVAGILVKQRTFRLPFPFPKSEDERSA